MSLAPPRFLLDADAFNHLHSLQVLLRLNDKGGVQITLTEYVARHELSQLQNVIRELEIGAVLRIEPVGSRDPNFKRLKGEGVDKGEAEAIAWALREPRGERPLFVSVDVKARKTALEYDIPTADLLDFMLTLVEAGVLSESEARTFLAPWEDRRQQRGRPKDFTTFDETVVRRRSRKNA